MFSSIARKLFGSRNDRILKQVNKRVKIINQLEAEIEALSDDELKSKTELFKKALADGKTLDDILVEAFAVVREASKRVYGMRHFDVQMTGGVILHEGKIAEMRTGEGKTLTATTATILTH